MRKRILIIEDEIAISQLLKIYLEKNLFLADTNGNGKTGLIKAINDHYDLIILDISLPGMDGLHILKKLREFKATPVIMISAQDDENVIRFFLKSGANDFVVKPFSCNSIVQKVKKLLN